MLSETLKTIAKVEFKQQLWETTRQLYQIERRFGFDAFERSGRYCFEKLQSAGLEEVELLSFPADGRTCYWDKCMPPAWSADTGRLEVTTPRDTFDDPVIADFDRNPFHLAMWSGPTAPGGIQTEIVTENMMLAGHSVRGRLVLAEPHHPARQIYQSVCDRGGVGIVSDYVKDPFVTPDGVQWVNSFGESPGWYPDAEDRQLVGLIISPRVGRRLRGLLVRGSVRVRAEVKATTASGTILSPTGIVRGADRPDEEIWLVAHLYEPCGTDNSSGAGVALTVARILSDLIRAGRLPRPRRSIRFVLTLELYGVTAMLKTLLERGKKLAATFVLDSPAAKQSLSGKPVTVFLSPQANPLFSDGPIRQAAELSLDPASAIWRSVNPDAPNLQSPKYVFAPGYLGNDAFLGDPLAGGPSFHFSGSDGPYWHNSENTLDTIWPELLAVMVPIHAGLAHHLAALGPENLQQMVDVVETESRQYLQEPQEHPQNPQGLAKAVAMRMEVVQNRFQNLLAWAGDEAGDLLQRIEQTRDRIAALAEDVLAAAGVAGINDNECQLDQLNRVDRMAATACFRRKEPTFPMSQAFVPDTRRRRNLTSQIKDVLARMDGKKHLLQIFEEVEAACGKPLNRRKMLGDCLFLLRWEYLDAELTEVVTKADLVAGMRRCGVREGDLIFVHSSLSAFGHIAGSAKAIIEAMLEAVGAKGTVLLPTFTRGMLYFDGILPRDYDLTPYHLGLRRCWTGAVPEAFLEQEGIVRSTHPTHSVAGIGPLAEKCLKDQRATDPPTGETSAFEKLVQLGGKIVYMGAPVGRATFLHYLETKLDLPYLTDSLCCIRGEHGEAKLVFVPKHLAGHRGFSGPGWRDKRIFKAMLAAGLKVRSATVSLGEMHAIDARQFEQKGLEAIRNDPAILLCEDPGCTFCSYWRRQLKDGR